MKICWAQYLLFAIISLFAIATMVTACGQKGALFLPKNQQQSKKTVPDKTQKQKEKPADKTNP